MKKRGFGQGRWNGVGGKQQLGENITQTAVRECQEEISVTPLELEPAAKINFHYSGDNAKDSQQVHVFTCRKWTGQPTESDEMKPKWFNLEQIPFDQMWDDDRYWLPLVLKGQTLTADFYFDPQDKIIDHSIDTGLEPDSDITQT